MKVWTSKPVMVDYSGYTSHQFLTASENILFIPGARNKIIGNMQGASSGSVAEFNIPQEGKNYRYYAYPYHRPESGLISSGEPTFGISLGKWDATPDWVEISADISNPDNAPPLDISVSGYSANVQAPSPSGGLYSMVRSGYKYFESITSRKATPLN